MIPPSIELNAEESDKEGEFRFAVQVGGWMRKKKITQLSRVVTISNPKKVEEDQLTRS